MKKCEKNKKFREGSRPAWGKTLEGVSPLDYCNAMTSKHLQPTECPFIYINGHAQQRACQSQKHGACSAFLLSHPRPNFRPSNPTSQPSISPHPRAKTDNPTGSFGSSACTFISPAPIFTSAGCISVHDPCRRFRLSEFMRSIRLQVPDIAGI